MRSLTLPLSPLHAPAPTPTPVPAPSSPSSSTLTPMLPLPHRYYVSHHRIFDAHLLDRHVLLDVLHTWVDGDRDAVALMHADSVLYTELVRDYAVKRPMFVHDMFAAHQRHARRQQRIAHEQQHAQQQQQAQQQPRSPSPHAAVTAAATAAATVAAAPAHPRRPRFNSLLLLDSIRNLGNNVRLIDCNNAHPRTFDTLYRCSHLRLDYIFDDSGSGAVSDFVRERQLMLAVVGAHVRTVSVSLYMDETVFVPSQAADVLSSSFFVHLPHVRTLVFQTSLECGVYVLAGILHRLPNVTSIDLTRSMRFVTESTCPVLARALLSLPSLAHVRLRENALRAGAMFHAVAAAAAAAVAAASTTMTRGEIDFSNLTLLAPMTSSPPPPPTSSLTLSLLTDSTALLDLLTLDLAFNRVTDAGCDGVARALLLVAPRLASLDLTCNRIGDKGCIGLARALPHLRHLEQLDMSCNGVTAVGLSELFVPPHGDGGECDDDGRVVAADGRAKTADAGEMTAVYALDADDDVVDGDGRDGGSAAAAAAAAATAASAKLPARFPSLRTLRMNRNRLGAGGVQAAHVLRAAMSTLPHLTHLDLAGNTILSNVAELLFASPSSGANSSSANGATSTVAPPSPGATWSASVAASTVGAAYAAVNPTMTTPTRLLESPLPRSLRLLRLDENPLDDAGCIALAGALTATPHLTSLSLAATGMRVAGCTVLARHLHVLPCLTHLDLSANALGDAGCAVLALHLSGDAARGRATANGVAAHRSAAAERVDGRAPPPSLPPSLPPPPISTLLLDANDIGDEGGIALGVALRSMSPAPRLVQLSMSNNRLGSAACLLALLRGLRAHRGTLQRVALKRSSGGNSSGMNASSQRSRSRAWILRVVEMYLVHVLRVPQVVVREHVP